MKPGVDATRAISKLTALRRGAITFQANILQDAGAFFLNRLVNETLNGAYVNRITGMLVRSQTLIPIEAGIMIAANLSIAPYAPQVAARTLARYGNDYLRITQHFTEPDIRKGVAKEWERLGEQIDKTGKYRYRNPYA